MALDIKSARHHRLPGLQGKLHYQAHAEGLRSSSAASTDWPIPWRRIRCCWRTGPVTWRWKS